MIRFHISLFIYLFCIGNSYAEPKRIVITSGSQLLSLSKKHSLELNKIQQKLELDQLNAESLISLYNWKITGAISGSNAEVAPTSPFAPAGGSDSLNSSLQLEKQMAVGITPYVGLNASSAKSFLNISPTPINIDYKKASVEVGARFDVMKLILANNAKFVFSEYKIRTKIAEVSQIISERNFEKNILNAHFNTIKSSKRREILNIQCEQYKKLRSITSSRYRRKLIREKDFLLVEVLYKQCLLDLEGARNGYRMAIESLKKNSGLYNFSFNYSKVNYPVFSPVIDLSLNKNRDLALSELLYSASESVSKKSSSQKLPELNFNLALRSEGSDVTGSPQYSEAFDQAFEGDFLTTEFGLNFSHSFGGSSKQLEAQKLEIQSFIDKTNLEQLRESLKRDVIRVGLNLSYFDGALRRVSEIQKLQKRKSVVFNKDFQNGRVAIRDLVEAEIAYLSSLQGTLNIQDLRIRAYLEAHDISGVGFEKFY